MGDGEREGDCRLEFLLPLFSGGSSFDTERADDADDTDVDRDGRRLVVLSCGRTITKRRLVGRSR
jgi:hypothetical protein